MSEITPIKTLVTIEPLNLASTAQNNAQTNTVLGNVANGTLLEGFVVNRTNTNQPVLRTQLGDILLNTELFLKTGTEVTIRVDTSQPNLARIITINGQPPEQFGEMQRLQATKLQNDSFADTLIATSVEPETAATPKPVQLPGVILQLAARQTFSAPVADALFNALGLAPTTNAQSPTSPNIPLSVTLRAITTPQTNPPPALATEAPSSMPTQTVQAIPSSNAAPPLIPTAAPTLPGTIPATANIPTPLTISAAAFIPQAQPIPIISQVDSGNAPVAATPPVTATPASPTVTPTAQPQQTVAAQPPASSIPVAAPVATTTPSTLPQSISLNAPIIPAPQGKEQLPPPAPLKLAATTPATPMQPTPLQATPATVAPSHTPSVPHTFSVVQITPERSILLQGLVIGQEQQSDTILHTPIGSMRIFTPTPLPSGAIVTMELTHPASEKGMENFSEPLTKLPPLDPVESLLREWPGLSELSGELERADPAFFQNTFSRILPAPGKQLTHMMLFFLSAIKSGDLKQWAGNRNIDMLETRYGELIRKLGADFGTLQQIFTDPSPQGWISASIPIYYDNTIEHARLHIRQDAENTSNKKQQGGQRFIIDVELSRLGEMQIDGLVQKEAGKHQFDIIIRTGKPLPPDIETNIRSIYNNASETAGFKGMLLFQPSREHFVTIRAKPRPDGQSGIIA